MINTFESMIPASYFFIYFSFSFYLAAILRYIFKKKPAYYMIFLSTVLFFSWFSKDILSTLPYDPLDVTRIISKALGSLIGIFTFYLWIKQRKQQKRRLF